MAARILTPGLASAANPRNASVQDSSQAPLSSTARQTQGGRTGPYKAAAFDLMPCSDLPSLDAIGDVTQASEILSAYLVRVGSNGTCLWDPNFQGLCNPPLSAATEYRWVPAATGGGQQLGPSPDSGRPQGSGRSHISRGLMCWDHWGLRPGNFLGVGWCLGLELRRALPVYCLVT